MSSPGVCGNQDSFNHAFRSAIKYDIKKEKPKKGVMIIGVIIMLVVVVWALLLAMKISPQEERVKHILLAGVFSPMYIISYYINKASME